MDAKAWTGDDDREFTNPDEPDRHQPNWDCECHCPTCHEPLGRSEFGPGYYSCGDCHGGKDVDGEAFRGGEAAAFDREQMAAAQRLKR